MSIAQLCRPAADSGVFVHAGSDKGSTDNGATLTAGIRTIHCCCCWRGNSNSRAHKSLKEISSLPSTEEISFNTVSILEKARHSEKRKKHRELHHKNAEIFENLLAEQSIVVLLVELHSELI